MLTPAMILANIGAPRLKVRALSRDVVQSVGETWRCFTDGRWFCNNLKMASLGDSEVSRTAESKLASRKAEAQAASWHMPNEMPSVCM